MAGTKEPAEQMKCGSTDHQGIRGRNALQTARRGWGSRRVRAVPAGCHLPPHPTTTSPWMPRRTASCTPRSLPGGIELAQGLHHALARRVPPAGHHLHGRGDSRSRRAGHRRDPGRYSLKAGDDLGAGVLVSPTTARQSSGSRWLASTVESTRSQNSTVSWRRSASGTCGAWIAVGAGTIFHRQSLGRGASPRHRRRGGGRWGRCRGPPHTRTRPASSTASCCP